MKVVYTSQAWLSIDSSIDFLFGQGLPPQKVTEIINQVFEKAESLAIYPYIGQREFMLQSRSKEYRRITMGHFKIIYFIDMDTIFVTDIFDSRQDPKKIKG